MVLSVGILITGCSSIKEESYMPIIKVEAISKEENLVGMIEKEKIKEEINIQEITISVVA